MGWKWAGGSDDVFVAIAIKVGMGNSQPTVPRGRKRFSIDG